MYEFMRDSQLLLYYSTLLIFNCIPEVDKQIGPEIREALVSQTYPELMVLRWAQTVSVDHDGNYAIRSPTGVIIDTDTLTELGLLSTFLDYFQGNFFSDVWLFLNRSL